jgi:hypothetical protein
VEDAEGDQGWNEAATKSGDPPHVPGGDLVGVDVVVDGETVCEGLGSDALAWVGRFS